MRFFLSQTKSYPKVGQSSFGRLIQNGLKRFGVKSQQHHVGIQQSWTRQGSASQWYPRDRLANAGLKRLGNSGFNLMSIPAGLNNALGKSALGTAAFAGATYGGIATAIFFISKEIGDAFDD